MQLFILRVGYTSMTLHRDLSGAGTRFKGGFSISGTESTILNQLVKRATLPVKSSLITGLLLLFFNPFQKTFITGSTLTLYGYSTESAGRDGQLLSPTVPSRR